MSSLFSLESSYGSSFNIDFLILVIIQKSMF